MSARLAEFLYRWRYPLSLICLLGGLALAPLSQVTHIDNDLTAWFSRSDPIYRDYERLRQEFEGSRTLIVAIEGDTIFTPEGLEWLRRISLDIERVPAVQRVYSLATANIVEALPPAAADDDGGGISVNPLIEQTGAIDPDAVRARALADPLLIGDLVSKNGRVTSILINFDEDRIEEVRAGVVDRIHTITMRDRPSGLRVLFNGSIEISETYNRVTVANMTTFTPPILLCTLAAIYALFRSVRKTLLALVAIGVSLFWTLGLYTLMGFSFNVLSGMIVSLVVVLAIADDIHIIQHFNEAARETGDRARAFKSTVAHLAVPLLAASGTTALGMLSLATSHVQAVRAFGIGAAVGVMVDFAISLVFVPTLLTLVRIEHRPPPQERWLLGPMRRVAQFSSRRARLVIGVAAVVAVAAIAGIFYLRVDTNHINFFRKGHPLTESAAVIDRDLSGVYSFQIFFEGPPESMREPEVLARMDRLQQRILKLPNVRKAISLVDYVKRVNRELHDGDAAAAIVPASRELIAQELFVLGLSDDGRRELEHIAASDYSRAQMTVRLASMSSDIVFAQINEAERLANEEFGGSGVTPTVTGSGRLFAELDHYLVMSQLSSFGTAFVTVFAVIFLIFRSFRFGLLAVVPNLFPVLAILGAMGWLDISLNVATVMLASVALGVVDDDTIHFISRYRREVAAGRSTDDAIMAATLHEGRAAITTALINSCAYAVLMTSEYRPTAWFGGLLALTMAVAFLAEVFILPATIKLLPKFYSAERLRMLTIVALVGGGVGLGAVPAWAQRGPVDGYVTVTGDYLPNAGDAVELRTRLFVERDIDAGPNLRFSLSGWAEGLVADRDRVGSVHDAVARPHEMYVDLRAGQFDVRAGLATLVWGRLDELQPSDVVNPLDISRFLFEGRSEARLPVPLVRTRWFASEALNVEGVWVPLFRGGRFDYLDEETSPFSLLSDRELCLQLPACPPEVTIDRREPARTLAHSQGGVRVNATTGRVDWSVSAYRGFEPFGIVSLAGAPPGGVGAGSGVGGVGGEVPPVAPSPIPLVETFPRFSMVASDVETIRGEWAIRGEMAVFVEDSFQSPDGLGAIDGRSVEGGASVERKAGDYRLNGALIVQHRELDPGPSDTAVSLVTGAQRTFARDTRRLFLFGVWNMADASGFLRSIGAWSLRDDLWVEGSLGWFFGEGTDTLSRFGTRDFAYLRLKAYF